MRHLRRLWAGELELDNAFWNWAVIGGLIVNLSSSAAFVYLIMAGQPIAALIAGYALSLPYNALVTVGVWRSAERYKGERRFADMARAVTVIGMVLLSIT